MKRLFILLILICGLMAAPVYAQTETPVIAYGEQAAGEVTNVNFENLFNFEGTAGDVVIIRMSRGENADFDPYLYLTTLQNELIAENDDSYDLDSQIITRLPADGTYQIVATRLGQRTGSGSGSFTLSLEVALPSKTGTVLEGTVFAGDTPATHIFVPPAAGIYTITYNHVRGEYFPQVAIQAVTDNYRYTEEVAVLGGQTLRGGSLTMEFELDAIYILMLREGYYGYSDSGRDAVYTLRIDEVPAE